MPQEELRKTRSLAHHERQYARADRIESAEMPYALRAQQPADFLHGIVRRNAARFIENDDTIHAKIILAAGAPGVRLVMYDRNAPRY